MKNTIIITAILFMAFSLNAQHNRSRSERSKRPEPARKEQVKRSTRSSQSVRQNRSSVRKSDANDQRRKSRSVNRSSSARSNNDAGERRSVRSSSSRKTDNGRSKSVTRDSRSRTYNHDNNRRSENRNSPVTRPSRTERESGRHSDNYRRETRREDNRSDRVTSAPREYKPRTGQRYEVQRRKYTARHPRRVKRPVTKKYYAYKPIEYRRVHYVYRRPPRHTIIWNISMYHDYVRWYPDFNLWYYPMGYRIHTISAYDAGSYIGEVARVYGEVYSTWYSRQTDEYYLYIGGPYPYQDFTIILERRDARRFSRRPERFFTGRHVSATGLISIFEGKPEMFLKKKRQIDVY